MAAQDDLLAEVRATIEKSLPAIQVDVFRRYVEEAEKAKKELASLTDEYKKFKEEAATRYKELETLRVLNFKAEEIKRDRENLDLSKRQFGVDQQLKDLQVKAAEEKIALINCLVHDIFRNIEMRNHILGQVPMVTKYVDGTQFTSQQSSELDETHHKE